MSGLASLWPLTLAEAEDLLASVGYSTEWTVEELRAAVPHDLRLRFAMALRVVAIAEHDLAHKMEVGL